MTDRIIASIERNSRETLRVTLGEFNGWAIAGIRIWFQVADGSWRPGKKGIAFKIDLLPAVSEALAVAVREARAEGLLPE